MDPSRKLALAAALLVPLAAADARAAGFARPEAWSDQFTVDAGWRVGRHPRALADVDGDGLADIVGFGETGVLVARSTGSGFAAPAPWVDNYSYNQGWRADAHPRHLVDVDLDGRADIVAFGELGVFVSRSTGAAFRPPSLSQREFGASQGWSPDRHPRVLADVDGDHRPDVVGFGDDGVHVALAGDAGFGAPRLWLDEFGHDQGWRTDRHLRLLADVDNDGRADLVGFGDAGVLVALAAADRFTPARDWSHDYGHDDGWQVDLHRRLVADVSRDGWPDVVGFGDAGTFLSLGREGGLQPARLVLTEFGQDQGWCTSRHLRLLADVDGDDRLDLVAFGGAGVFLAISHGAGFDPPALALAEFGHDQGWRRGVHLRLLADVTGDDLPDIVAFGDSAVLVARAEP